LDEEYKTKRKGSNDWNDVSIDSNMNSINLLQFSSDRKFKKVNKN